jgi:hypothetical protein
MKGGDVLCYVRDALLKVAADKRSFLERPPPGWVMGMAAQARVALSSPEGENQG